MSTPTSIALHAILNDEDLRITATKLDIIERTRIASENFLRQITRDVQDSDGKVRGFGLAEDEPIVVINQQLVDSMVDLEKSMTKDLEKLMSQHPLSTWQQAPQRKGVGRKQLARLLGALGDPYWHTLHDRPRAVDELWAYCGLHPVKTKNGNWVAAKRERGRKANWSADAKKRVWLIAKQCVITGGPYREVYDQRRIHTEGRLHIEPCVRCGPKDKPALAGSPWSKAHAMGDALRFVGKRLLLELWIESRRLHQQNSEPTRPDVLR